MLVAAGVTLQDFPLRFETLLHMFHNVLWFKAIIGASVTLNNTDLRSGPEIFFLRPSKIFPKIPNNPLRECPVQSWDQYLKVSECSRYFGC